MAEETRKCQGCGREFVIEPEDFGFYARMKVPPPTFCPECRLQSRLAWRNERALYKRPCDLCRKSVIAMYSPDKPFKVYCLACFNSDKWDPMSYGRDYDFSRPFFLQFQELQHDIPHLALLQVNMVNSPWCNYETDEKNCYLNFGGHNNEDSAYNQYALKAKDTFDTYWFQQGEFGYEATLSENCYKVFYSKLCYDCREAYFSFDCRNCSNIFGCSGLRNKQYHIFNKPVSKEEFESFLKDNLNGSRLRLEEVKNKVFESWKSKPQRAVFIERSVNSTGNLVNESRRCSFCWLTEKAEDSKYAMFVLQVKDSYDVTSVWSGELLYEVMGGVEQIANIRFTAGVLEGCTDIEYSYFIFGSHHCFGSMNLKKEEYCILNKRYTKEDYESLAARIRKHMDDMPYTDKVGRVYRYGEFLPFNLSPFAYNETVAYEYFPLKEAEAEKAGLAWGKYEAEPPVFSGYVIPDDIHEVQDDILEKVLKCEVSGKGYRVIPIELAFYRRFNIPIPRLAPFERHKWRLRFIADHLKFYSRKCEKCARAVDSVYTAEEFPAVYCEACYNSEVV